MPIYIIEHMEDDDNETKSIPEWVALEYSHMLSLAGPQSTVLFSNLSSSSKSFLDQHLSSATESERAKMATHTEGILPMLAELNITIDQVCLLDPKAKQELSPEDGQRFQHYLFGGILGDDPPRDRTSQLRLMGFPSRHLGPIQMTTDTALGVTKMVVHDEVPLSRIPYTDFPTITFSPKESVEMPFRYIAKGGAPILPPGMKDLLYRDLNKSFDF